jgi:hypothetical protein
VIANGDNEGQWLKRDLYGQLKSGVLGDTFSRASGRNFVGSDLKDSIPASIFPQQGIAQLRLSRWAVCSNYALRPTGCS